MPSVCGANRLTNFPGIFPVGRRKRLPMGPILLIVVGVIFLLETLEIVRLYQIVRYWPVFLILLGCYMLYMRCAAKTTGHPPRAGGVQ